VIIECFDGRIVRLTEPLDSRRLKLVLHTDAPLETQGWKGIMLRDDLDALVLIDLAPTLAGHPDDKSWDQRYAEMVAKAREYG
jgi:hypothetical protein